MNHEKWDDDKIEELLSNVPKIHDHRSKDDVFKRLQDEGVFEEELVPMKQKKKINWLPFIISVAAILVLAIVGTSFTKQMNQESLDSTAQEAKEISNDASRIMDTGMEEESMGLMAAEMTNLSTAVYPDELEGKTVFQLGLASDAADSVPVTVLIPNERIQQDFGNTNPTGVALYNQYAENFNESAIGFREYHPFVGNISEQGNQVIHTLPSNQPYDTASASSATYTASLFDTFHYYYDEVLLRNEDGSIFEFSEAGEPSKPIPLKAKGQFNYFKHTQADGSEYLTPNFRVTYKTVEEALMAMKEETNDIYKTVILPEVEYEISITENVVVVTFTKQLDLMNYDQGDAMQMIEGILLTASGFNKQVLFNNIAQIEWQGFNFADPLPMPVAPNEIPYETVFQ
ncbi:hypothetical protein [Lysinibacillus antri]|uniref:Sigma-X negative effector n=1 Tax=Lysinibacillus antri TaxID=2498145 RepID=A0A3S0PR22_9BACI|nr:hypothetical protein [Lysinibacillus antri]RUL55071.1 hypothetical protein EK386_04920 [Lysinibacillus antri]